MLFDNVKKSLTFQIFLDIFFLLYSCKLNQISFIYTSIKFQITFHFFMKISSSSCG